jgi:quercetin dioxygenase-like cupin family protein
MVVKRHEKGWGYEDWLVNNKKYCGKILHFNKGKLCSLHYHKLKDETFYILKGYIVLEVNTKKYNLRQGNTFRIKPLTKHRIYALTDADIIEISTQHFEKDSYRIERGN